MSHLFLSDICYCSQASLILYSIFNSEFILLFISAIVNINLRKNAAYMKKKYRNTVFGQKTTFLGLNIFHIFVYLICRCCII